MQNFYLKLSKTPRNRYVFYHEATWYSSGTLLAFYSLHKRSPKQIYAVIDKDTGVQPQWE